MIKKIVAGIILVAFCMFIVALIIAVGVELWKEIQETTLDGWAQAVIVMVAFSLCASGVGWACNVLFPD